MTWAIENGATHFTHWFQPQRNGTAEKHDAFITYDSEGGVIEKFSKSQLISQNQMRLRFHQEVFVQRLKLEATQHGIRVHLLS